MLTVVPARKQPLTVTLLGNILYKGDRLTDITFLHMKVVCHDCTQAKGNAPGLCAMLYVNNTKLTPSGSHEGNSCIKAKKKAHLGLLSLGKTLVNEEEMKTKEKGSSCMQLFVQLEFAFGG